MKAKKILKVTTLIILSILFVMFASIFLILEPRFPVAGFQKLDESKLISTKKNTQIFDSSNNKIDCISNCSYAKLSDVPKHTVDAFISIEDQNFYSHNGISYKRMLSSLVTNIQAGDFKEGASTITQQLVKNTHLSTEKTLSRKIQEIRIAKEVEKTYTKDEIMEYYLNILYFGNNIYGISNAANKFFGKNINEITISESAFLAGIINNPSKYNPYSNYNNAIDRRNLVLKQMEKLGKISSVEKSQAENYNISILNSTTNHNNYFNDVLAEASNILHMKKTEILKNNYKIKTNYNQNISDTIDKIINDKYSDMKNKYNIVVIDNSTGNVVSNLGNSSQITANTLRAPASTIKPFIYALGLENGQFTSSTPILDEKISFGDYKPSNYLNKYSGWISIEDALSNSLNIPAIKALEIVGIEKFVDFAQKFGLNIPKADKNLTLAVGGMSNGISLIDLAHAYSIFANGGKKISSNNIDNITDADGNKIYYKSPIASQVIGDDTAYIITDILKKCSKNGTAQRLKSLKFEQAAKTGTNGTSNGNTDAYCITYNTTHTIAVWCGYDNNEKNNNLLGGSISTKIANDVLNNIYKTNPSNFICPNSIVYNYIDSYEYYNNHIVAIADNTTPPINKMKKIFSSKCLPKIYAKPNFNNNLTKNNTIKNYNKEPTTQPKEKEYYIEYYFDEDLFNNFIILEN